MIVFFSSWNLDATDWNGNNLTTVWNNVLSLHSSMPTNSSMVPLHHGFAYTESGTKGLIEKYVTHFKPLGYKFVTANKCFKACLEDGGTSCFGGGWPGVYTS